MSRYESYLIKAGLIYLLITGVLGVLFYIMPLLQAYFRTTHLHLGLTGFFLSMVMGVAYWMMPRPGGLRQERQEALTFYLLNVGLVLRLISEPAWRYTGGSAYYALVVISGLLQLAAMGVFVLAMWQRVKTADEILKIRQRIQAEKQV